MSKTLLVFLFFFSLSARSQSSYCDSLSNTVLGYTNSYSGSNLGTFTDLLADSMGAEHWDTASSRYVNNTAVYWYTQMQGCGITIPAIVSCSAVTNALSNFYAQYPQYDSAAPNMMWSSYLNEQGAGTDIMGYTNWFYTPDEWMALFIGCGITGLPVSMPPATTCDTIQAIMNVEAIGTAGFSPDDLTNELNEMWAGNNDFAYWLPQITGCGTSCTALLNCAAIDTAMSQLPGYGGSGPPYPLPFAEAYLQARFQNLGGLDSASFRSIFSCCAVSNLDYTTDTLSYCDQVEYLRFLVQYNLPNHSCLPNWLYTYMISQLRPLVPAVTDSTNEQLCADLTTCKVTCLPTCDTVIVSLCDSLASVGYVYHNLLAGEGLSVDTQLLSSVYTVLFGAVQPYTTTMNQINNCSITPSVLTHISYSAQNVQYSDSAGHNYVDFDVFCIDSPAGLLYSQSNLYIHYNSLFGTNLVSSGTVTASKGTVISNPDYTMILSDSLPQLLKIKITHSDSVTSLPTIATNQQLCHLRVNLSSLNLTAIGVAWDTIAMAGQSEYKQTPNGLEYPYDLVEVGGLVGDPVLATTIYFTIANPTLSGSPLPAYLDFDISATSPINSLAAAPLADYSVALLYNTLAFDSVWVTNSQVNNLGDDGSNDGGDGSHGGDALYGFSDSVSGGAIVITLSDTGDYDLTSTLQYYDNISYGPLAHVRLHIYACDNLPDIVIDPTSSSGDWGDYTNNEVEAYTPIDTNNGSFNNGGAPMCVLPPRVFNWSPTCTNAGSFEQTIINGAHFGDSIGTIYFTNADSPSIFVHTIPQDIISWSDNQISLIIPSQPRSNTIAASGQFYVLTAGAMDNYDDNTQMSIGYANYNVRNVSPMNTDYLKPMFVYYTDSPFVFQLDSALFFNVDARNSLSAVVADMNCYTGIQFILNTDAPALIDSPVANDGIHLICLKPYSPTTFKDSTVLAFTDLSSRLQTCNNSLSQYNNAADYVMDVDITVNATPVFGHTWLWKDTIPSSTQVSFATDMAHELGHAALLQHTQPQSGHDVMYPIINAGNYYPNFSGDPDDALGIYNMLTLGQILGTNGCQAGMICHANCVSPLIPDYCYERQSTTNAVQEIPNSSNNFTATLYPNPYEGTTVVHIDVSEYTNFNITVYTVIGQVVRQINIASAVSFDIPLSGFEEGAGLYLIQVSDMHNRQVLKMIKM